MSTARRHYSPNLLGPTCEHCTWLVPLALGKPTHPTCGPEVTVLMRAERVRVKAQQVEAQRLAVVTEINRTASR